MSKIIRVAPTTKLPRVVTVYSHDYVFEKDAEGLVSCEVSDELHRQRLCSTGAYSLESDYARQQAKREQAKRDMINNKTRELTIERTEQAKKNQEKIEAQIDAKANQQIAKERAAMQAEFNDQLEAFKRQMMAEMKATHGMPATTAAAIVKEDKPELDVSDIPEVVNNDVEFKDDESLSGPKRLGAARHAYKNKFGEAAPSKMKLDELLAKLEA